MFNNLIAYFEHNKSERNGAIAILIILLIVGVASQLFYLWYEPPLKEISPFAELKQEIQDEIDKKENGYGSIEKSFAEPFLFNPNTLSDSGYTKLGFSEKQIATLRNYQKAGAEFNVKSDFKKLYFVDDKKYEELEEFIDLPDYKPKKEFKKPEFEQKDFSPKRDTTKWSDTTSIENYTFKPFTCDLNLADTTELKKLPYIGSFYAREIVRYRNELGGYHSLAQLLELYKMKPETIDKFADRVTIDKSEIRRVNINKATTQELSAHPYIDFALANKIVAKRETDATFKNMEQLCNSGLLNVELCSKLAPYLSFE